MSVLNKQPRISFDECINKLELLYTIEEEIHNKYTFNEYTFNDLLNQYPIESRFTDKTDIDLFSKKRIQESKKSKRISKDEYVFKNENIQISNFNTDIFFNKQAPEYTILIPSFTRKFDAKELTQARLIPVYLTLSDYVNNKIDIYVTALEVQYAIIRCINTTSWKHILDISNKLEDHINHNSEDILVIIINKKMKTGKHHPLIIKRKAKKINKRKRN